MSGRVVVITGGGGGIGAAMAFEFAAAGDRVVACDLSLPAAEAAVCRLPVGTGEARQLDVADAAAVSRVMASILADHGRIDVLCNNAGIGCWTNVEDTSDADWDRTMATNVGGTFLCSRAVIPAMRSQGKGSIVNTASVHSFQSWAGCSVYAASKGAVLAFTRALAMELIADGIRVNALAPGTTDTPMVRFGRDGLPTPAAELEAETRSIPTGRMADPREIARAAVFLAGDDASFVVGQCLVVDGGTTARL